MAELDLDALADSLPAHYFDCERFNVDHSGRQGKCDCNAVSDIPLMLMELRQLRAQWSNLGAVMDRAKELMRDMHIAVAQRRDDLPTRDEMIAALDAEPAS